MSIRYGSVAELEASADPGLVPNNPGRLGRRSRSLGPTPGGAQRLTRAVGKAKDMELCLTGRRTGAERQVTLKTHAVGSCGSSKGGASAFSGRSFEITNRGVVSGCDFIRDESGGDPPCYVVASIHETNRLKCLTKLQIIELGPGRVVRGQFALRSLTHG